MQGWFKECLRDSVYIDTESKKAKIAKLDRNVVNAL